MECEREIDLAIEDYKAEIDSALDDLKTDVLTSCETVQ